MNNIGIGKKFLAGFILLVVNTVLYLLIAFIGPVIFLVVLSKNIMNGDAIKYMVSTMVSNDQHGGTLIFGTEDWTISSNLYRYRDESVWNFFRRVVNYFAYRVVFLLYKLGLVDEKELQRQKTHCESAYIKEQREFRYRADKSIATLHIEEQREWFDDESNHYLLRKEDDGSLTCWMSCEWELILKENDNVKVLYAGACGTGISYDPETKTFSVNDGVM